MAEGRCLDARGLVEIPLRFLILRFDLMLSFGERQIFVFYLEEVR